MTDPPPNPEEPKGDRAGPSDDLAAAPASKPVIVEDTSRGSIDLDKARTEDFRTTAASTAQGTLLEIQGRYELHAGPLPSPAALREYKDIYPDAPKLIFEEFRAQSAHRRKIEESVIATKNRLAIRGQVIGAILGGIGLGGSLVVAALGHGWAGFGIAVTSLGGLVSIFVIGREEQKKERLRKAKIQEEIKKGQSVEKLEKDKTSPSKGS